MKVALRSALLVSILTVLAACGTGDGGDDGPEDTEGPPTAPANVRAVPGPGYVIVTWEDRSDDETAFVIYRDEGAAAATVPAQVGTRAGEVSADSEAFVDMGASLGVSTSYRVVAVNEHGESPAEAASEAVTMPPGVGLRVGTNDRPFDDGTGTTFVTYYVFPEDVLNDESTPFDVTITGPAGWNDGEPLEFTEHAGGFARNGGFTIDSASDVDAVAGDYHLSVAVGDDVYESIAALLEPDFKLGPPTNITITEATAERVTMSWDAPAGSRSAMVSLWRGDYEELIAGRDLTTDTTYTFEGLNLEDDLYQVEVAPVNVDLTTYPEPIEPLGLSYDTRSLGVGDVVAAACSGPDQVVAVPDTALADAIRDASGRDTGDLTCMDLATLTELSVEDRGIASLEGLQYAVNLGNLDAGGNDIDDVSPLAGLEQLDYLGLNENRIDDLTPLADLTQLRGLFICCESNAYTDISPLAGLTQLEMLDVGGHQLTDPSVLSGFPNLTNIWAWDAGLTDIAFLDDMPDLAVVVLSWNDGITDLTPLESRTDLQVVELQGLGLQNEDIAFLEAFTELEELQLAENELTDLAPLVANLGLDDGDYVTVDENLLDLTSGSDAMNDIQALEARGVEIVYEPQND